MLNFRGGGSLERQIFSDINFSAGDGEPFWGWKFLLFGGKMKDF